jgi:hypothetical protein
VNRNNFYKNNLISLIFIVGLSIWAVVACAPSLSERIYAPVKQDFKPRYEDPDLLQKYQQEDYFTFNRIVSLEANCSMGAALRIIENLFNLQALTGEEKIGAAATRLNNKIHALDKEHETVLVKNSPYTELLVTNTQELVSNALKAAESKILKSVEQSNQLVQQLGREKKWLDSPQNVFITATAISNFLQEIRISIKNAEMFEPVKTAILSGLENKKNNILSIGDKLNQGIKKSTRLNDMTALLTQIIRDEKIDLPEDISKKLLQGQEIAKGLMTCNSAQSAMSVLVNVWYLLDANERETNIKSVNSELFELLNHASSQELECLRKSSCSFLRRLKKDIFVLSKVESYGVAKLCSEVNDKAQKFAIKSLEEMGPQLFVQVPNLVVTTINNEASKKLISLREIQKDYFGFVSEKLQNWSQTKLPAGGLLSALDLGTLKLSLTGREIQMQLLPSKSASAESIGVGLSLISTLLSRELPRELSQARELSLAASQKLALEGLNQLISLSGYQTHKQQLTPAWATPLEKGAPLLDISSFIERADAFSVTDILSMKQGYLINAAVPTEVNLSALGQAELLRGISRMMNYLKDWQVTNFESSLGLVKAKNLVPEFDIDELDRPLFPKAELYTLALADAAVLLKNITKNYSQFFVVDLNNKTKWVNEFDFKNGETSALAGVVDIKNGRRANTVHAEDVSRWIIAISDFLKATEGIENTKSKILLDSDSAGHKPLDTIIEARKDLRLLLIGLSNFLSSHLLGPDGLVINSFDIVEFKSDFKKNIKVLDQALAIRALLAAAQATKVNLYEVSAVEIYYKMNNTLYNPKTRFYTNLGVADRTISLPVALDIVLALSELKPVLPPDSQKQLSWILQPWYAGFKTLY